jgi:hypothetical protein
MYYYSHILSGVENIVRAILFTHSENHVFSWFSSLDNVIFSKLMSEYYEYYEYMNFRGDGSNFPVNIIFLVDIQVLNCAIFFRVGMRQF